MQLRNRDFFPPPSLAPPKNPLVTIFTSPIFSRSTFALLISPRAALSIWGNKPALRRSNGFGFCLEMASSFLSKTPLAHYRQYCPLQNYKWFTSVNNSSVLPTTSTQVSASHLPQTYLISTEAFILNMYQLETCPLAHWILIEIF